MSERKRVFKWFWIWQDEKYEAWLTQMSKLGWHLEKVNYITGVIFHFVKGEPKDFIYKLDYKQTGDGDIADYIEIFKSAGWDYVAQDIAWKYFRREAVSDENPDIYSDNESKILKYKNLINLIWVLCLAEFIAGVNLIFTRVVVNLRYDYDSAITHILKDFWFMGLLILLIAVTTLLIVGIFKLKKKIKKLEKPLQEDEKQKVSTGNNVMSKIVKGLLILESVAILLTFTAGVASIWELSAQNKGWQQIQELKFESSNLKDLTIYQFMTDGNREINFRYVLTDFNFKKLINLEIVGDNGTKQLIVHGEQYWSNYNQAEVKYKLKKGKYKVVLNVANGNGKFKLYTK